MGEASDTVAMGWRPRGEPEDGQEPVVDPALAEELVACAREQGVELLEPVNLSA